MLAINLLAILVLLNFSADRTYTKASCTSPDWVAVSSKQLDSSLQKSLQFNKDLETYCKSECLSRQDCVTFDSVLIVGSLSCYFSASYTPVVDQADTTHYEYKRSCMSSSGIVCSFLYIGEYSLLPGSFSSILATDGEDCLQNCVTSSSCQVVSYLNNECQHSSSEQTALAGRTLTTGWSQYLKGNCTQPTTTTTTKATTRTTPTSTATPSPTRTTTISTSLTTTSTTATTTTSTTVTTTTSTTATITTTTLIGIKETTLLSTLRSYKIALIVTVLVCIVLMIVNIGQIVVWLRCRRQMSSKSSTVNQTEMSRNDVTSTRTTTSSGLEQEVTQPVQYEEITVQNGQGHNTEISDQYLHPPFQAEIKSYETPSSLINMVDRPNTYEALNK